MKREEFLDRLIDRHDYQENRQSGSNDEMSASLAAIEALTRLQKISVPPEFTHRLELSIRERARSQSALQQNGWSVSTPLPRESAKVRRRSWVAVGIAAVLVLTFASLITFFASGLIPHVHQAKNPLLIPSHDNPQDPANVEAVQLHGALNDLRATVNARGDDKAIKQALDTVATSTLAGQKAVAALPAGADHDTSQHNLGITLTEEDQTLRNLLKQVDWSMKLAFTQQLGVLGDAVPKVTYVSVRIQANGALLITLTGLHFAPQAGLVINGTPMGTVTQSTSVQLVAVVSGSNALPETRAFGILNPDGTAAQILAGDDSYDHGNDD